MTKDDEHRAFLLAELERYNEALADNDARPLVTPDKVGGMPLPDLAVIVEATSHRLADIVKTSTWRS